MDTSTIVSILGLCITVLVNLGMVFFWSGKITTLITCLKELVETYQEQNKEHFKTLEKKQDKHNNLIERMAIVEQSTKSSHRRQDDFGKRISILEERVNK